MSPAGLNSWEGDCVRLRAPRIDDWETYDSDGADSESARRNWEIPFPRSPEGTRKWLENLIAAPASGDNRFLAIETLVGEIVGSISSSECHRTNGTFRFGLGIFRAQRRKGYARDAIRVLLRYFFDELGSGQGGRQPDPRSWHLGRRRDLCGVGHGLGRVVHAQRVRTRSRRTTETARCVAA